MRDPILFHTMLNPVELACGNQHVFDRFSIQRWLKNNDSCPCCRAAIDKNTKYLKPVDLQPGEKPEEKIEAFISAYSQLGDEDDKHQAISSLLRNSIPLSYHQIMEEDMSDVSLFIKRLSQWIKIDPEKSKDWVEVFARAEDLLSFMTQALKLQSILAVQFNPGSLEKTACVQVLNWLGGNSNDKSIHELWEQHGSQFINEVMLNGNVGVLAWLAGQDDAVKQLLLQPDKSGITIAHMAAEQGQVDVLAWLAGHEDPDLKKLLTQPCSGMTIAHVAAANGRRGILNWLAGHEDPDLKKLLTQPDKTGMTIAHFAAKCGQVKVLDWVAGHEDSDLRKLLTQSTKDGRNIEDVAVGQSKSLQWFQDSKEWKKVRATLNKRSALSSTSAGSQCATSPASTSAEEPASKKPGFDEPLGTVGNRGSSLTPAPALSLSALPAAPASGKRPRPSLVQSAMPSSAENPNLTEGAVDPSEEGAAAGPSMTAGLSSSCCPKQA